MSETHAEQLAQVERMATADLYTAAPDSIPVVWHFGRPECDALRIVLSERRDLLAALKHMVLQALIPGYPKNEVSGELTKRAADLIARCEGQVEETKV